jgi:HD superfamily phosphohydrolase
MHNPLEKKFRPGVEGCMDKNQLSTLVDMDSPEAVHNEVVYILRLINPNFNTSPVYSAFIFTKELYEGGHPDYKACNTPYHNFRHINDTFLAMARLLHGAHLSGEKFNERQMVLGVISALMHDTGMLQESHDSEGTGAKFTQDHVKLSMNFIEQQADRLNLTGQEVADMQNIILCTDLMAEIQAINFSAPEIELLGKMLGTADLIAQMADRTYLEKLLFLFHEFREAQMGDFKNEIDFLRQTLNFYEISESRFDKILANTNRYMVPHFKERWDIQTNLYVESLNKQRSFLKKILDDDSKSIYEELKRDKIVKKVRKEYGKLGKPDTT